MSGWGIMERPAKFITGIGGGLGAAGGWVVDIVSAPFNDDEEFNGFWNTLSGRTMTRLGEVAENAIGPDEGLGALIGGLPGWVREPAKSSLEGLDQLGAHAIRRPIATSQVLLNERGQGRWGAGMGAFNPSFWLVGLAGRSPDEIREAWNATEHLSVGQALAFNISDTSLFDGQQRTEFMGSDYYRYSSGLTDAAFRIFADVDVLAAKGFQVARLGAATRGVRSRAVIDAAYEKYNGLLDEWPGSPGGMGAAADDVPPFTGPTGERPRVGPGGQPVETPHGSPAMFPGGNRPKAIDPSDYEYRPTFEVGPDGEIREVSRFRPNVEGRRAAAVDDLADEVPEWMMTRAEWRGAQSRAGRSMSENLYDEAVEAALEAGERVPAEVLLQNEVWATEHLASRALDLATDAAGRTALGDTMRDVAAHLRRQLDEPWARGRPDAAKAVDDLDEIVRDYDAAVAASDDVAAAAALNRAAEAWARFSPSAEQPQMFQMLLDRAGSYRHLVEPGRFTIPGDPFAALYQTPLDEVLDHTRRAVAREGGDIDTALAGARLTHKADVMRALRERAEVPDEVLARYAHDADVQQLLRARDRALTTGARGQNLPEPAVGPAAADDVFEPTASDIRDPGQTFDTGMGTRDAPPGPSQPPPPPPNAGRAGGAGPARPFGHEVDDKVAWLAGKIRGLDFSDHALGGEIAYWLARATAEGGPEAFNQVWRFLAGDVDQLVAISRSNEVMAARLSKLFDTDGLIDGAPGWLDDVKAKIARGNLDEASKTGEQALPEEVLLELSERMTGVWGAIQRTPTYFLPEAAETLGQKAATALNTERIRQNVVASEFWHSGGLLGRGVRSFFNMRPHHVVDLNSTQADVQLQRVMRDAGFDADEIATWRGRYNGAFGTPAKQQVWLEAEQAAWRKIAANYDHLDEAAVQRIAREMSEGRMQTRQVLERKTAYDGEGRAWVHLSDELGEAQIPLGRTQTQNVMPIVDFKLVERFIKRYDDKVGKFAGTPQATERAADAFGYLLDQAAKYWKASALLRPGWTMRVVVMDEQLRLAAKFGAMSTALDLVRSNARNLTHDYMQHFGLHGDAGISKAGNVGMAIGGGTGFVLGGPVGAAIGAAGGRGLMRRMAQMDEVYRPQLTINGYKLNAAFGAPGDEAEIFRRLSSSHQDWVELIAQNETEVAENLYRHLGGWDTVAPTDSARYGQAWEWALNKQIGQDGIRLGGEFHDGPFRRFLRGETKAQVAEWLTTTRAGRAYMRDMHPLRRHRTTEWLDAVEDQARAYTANYNPRIVENVLNNRASYDDLRQAVPDINARPPIHGQSLEQTTGKGPMQAQVDDFIQRAFHVLGSMPSDRLSRWPAFQRFYEMEMTRLVKDIPEGAVPAATIRKLEGQARQYALTETRELMYDLAERSEFGEMIRNIMPFYGAWQEVMTRWAGIAAENPAFVARLSKVWNAPDAADMIHTDDDGNESIILRLPESAKGLLSKSPFFESALDETGAIRLPKRSFNMLAEGMPGFGPFVQLPIGKLVREVPEAEQAFEWMFPYGAPDDVVDAFIPAWGRRVRSLWSGGDDRAYAYSYNQILQAKLVKMEEGLIEPMSQDELLDQVKTETDRFFALRAAVNFITPVGPIYDSPYAPYIEVYRELRLNTDDADSKFLEMFGEEYFWLTRSFTKTNDGIPATLPGKEAREQYQGLIERHPELGGLIVGSEGTGAQVRFSSAMYDRQLKTPIREGSDVMQREPLSPEEFLTSGQESQGWQKFVRAMDLIDAARIEAGLPNLQVSAAKPLANMKRSIIEQLAVEHPDWYRAYSEVDMTKWNDKLIGLWAIADDERLAQRPDIQGLRQYLEARELITSQLENAPARTLSASANQRLSATWEAIVNSLVERNLAFGELYHRYLENDPVTIDTRRANLTPMRETV